MNDACWFKGFASALGPGGVCALGNLEGDLKVITRVFATGMDFVGQPRKLLLVPLDLFRQLGGDFHRAILKAHRAGILTGHTACRDGALLIAKGNRTFDRNRCLDPTLRPS